MTNIETLHRDSIDGLKTLLKKERNFSANVKFEGFDARGLRLCDTVIGEFGQKSMHPTAISNPLVQIDPLSLIDLTTTFHLLHVLDIL